MEYMEQQMQNQIDGGMYEAARCYDLITKLEAERDALAAQNADYSKRIVHLESIRDLEEARLSLITDIVNATLNTNTATAPIEAVIAIGDALDADRSKCLAEIRAEAGRAGFIAGCKHTDKPNRGMWSTNDLIEHANQYAESIRKGGAK
jgi:hypothetical protein